MENVKAEIEKYGLTAEQYEQCLLDSLNKVNKINDMDWEEIIHKYNLGIHYDTLRKASQTIFGGAFVYQYFREKEIEETQNDYYIQQLKAQQEELFKEKKKFYDQRREYNKLLVSDARAEHLTEQLLDCANKINKTKPLEFNDAHFTPNIHKEAVLCWSDWHYGMTTDNIWNTYNTEICRNRVKTLTEMVKDFIKINKIDKLHIVMLGDACHGAIHTTCRIASEEDVCDQLMHVSEIMAESINDMSSAVNHINVYSCYGNHMRTIQDKDDNIHTDNMEKIIPWWLNERLKDNNKVEIISSEYKEFTDLNVLGYNIVCVHGDLDKFKNLGVTLNTIFTKRFGKTVDYTISGDKHHLEEFEQFDIESVLIRSLCGSDDYANNKRLYGKAGQTLMIFNDEYGRESTYHIPLK